MSQIPDLKARQTALDVSRSFIVQAPAGSGKTSLLTQRYLALLARVKNPEEIIAITFTKKAAGEMQERVIEALELAMGEEPSEDYLKQTYNLAKLALKHNELQKWNLFENKHRLRILTIDAFCLLLTNRMPLLSKAIPFSGISENADELYETAAEQCLDTAFNDKDYIKSLEIVQSHLGNNKAQLVSLFILMLQKRDQWLKHVISASSLDLDYFENVLQEIQMQLCQELDELLADDIKQLLENIISYQAAFTDDAIFNEMPPLPWDEFSFCKKLANLLLSSSNKARKRFTINEGFPAATSFKTSDEKTAAKEIKKQLSEISLYIEENNQLLQVLEKLKILPEIAYNNEQWQVLQAVINLLPLLAAELSVTFNQSGKVDFTEIALQALQAMGGETPTELALYLDYEISHLLIDEFQDTSKKQFNLLEQLTESWHFDDCKTLFLVGDPMQSIYRFREADVNIFLNIQENSLNQVDIAPLQLNCNFRSSAALITGVNKICAGVFPIEPDFELGAVTYAASKTLNENNQNAFYGIDCQSKQLEADYIAKYVNENPDETIAILVRSRSQLQKIVPTLKHAGINVEGVDLESLNNTYIIKVLWQICRFLVNPNDKLALSSILVSPLCGIDYQELELLFNKAKVKNEISFEALSNSLDIFSIETQQRLIKIFDTFSYCHSLAYRKTLLEITHFVWLHLNGGQIINDEQIDDVNQFWGLLEQHQQWPLDLNIIERQLEKKYSSKPSKRNVKIMTIHRSKGLEFDTVILPSVDYSSADKNSGLLHWLENPNNEQLLLSPIHSAFDVSDPLVNYIRFIDKQKSSFERQRLFYVALTRAKTKLVLINSSDKENQQGKNSFLYYLKDHINFKKIEAEDLTETAEDTKYFQRLKQQFFENVADLNTNLKHNPLPKTLKQDPQQIIGTFIHEQLFHIAENNLTQNLNEFNIDNMQSKLTSLGLDDKQLENAITTSQLCLKNIEQCKIGQWILSSRTSARNEYQLNTLEGNFIIDRTFIEDDVRWIIDYKISRDLNKNATDYKQQLENYANLFEQMGESKIKLMLYYPLLKKSIEWAV